MSGMRGFMSTVALGTFVGIGYVLWAVIAPGEDKRKELLKNLPESNPVRMEETRRRNALVLQALKEAAESNTNIVSELSGPRK